MNKVDESKIFSPKDFEYIQEVEYGFCKNDKFPENCPGECRYCDFYFFYPKDYEEGIKWLQDDSDLLEQQLTVERSEEHTSELQSRGHLVCRLLLEKKKTEQN